MERLIKIVDNGAEKYEIEPRQIVLGRRYDNEAEEIVIETPASEIDSYCIMIITDNNGQVVDHISMVGNRCYITSNLSQYRYVYIGFSFQRANGYIKNSNIIKGEFLEAQRPDGFVPVPAEQRQSIEMLSKNAFVDSRLNGNSLEFFNTNGDVVVSYDLSPFTQAQSDWEQTDSTQETFIRNKPTKLSQFENDLDIIPPNVSTTNKLVDEIQLNERIGAIDNVLNELNNGGGV